MRYEWRDYTTDDAACVDGWMDDEAVHYTGCDDGWDDYISYMMQEPYVRHGSNFWCKLILDNHKPIAVAALYLTEENVLCISELVVDSHARGLGHGKALLRELLDNTVSILGCDIRGASVVIFPNNLASIRAFSCAGFSMTHAHPDGDALYYQYDIPKTEL